MTLDEYQKKALMTAVRHNNDPLELFRLVLGLAGESGEVAGKFKKIYRDKKGRYDNSDIEEIKKELGDVLWYVAVISDCLDIKLDDVAAANEEKLKRRAKRDQIKGSGDNR